MKAQYSNSELLVNKYMNVNELFQKFSEGVTKKETIDQNSNRKRMINYTVFKNRLINLEVQYSECESVTLMPKLYKRKCKFINLRDSKSKSVPQNPFLQDSNSLNMKNKCKILVYKLKKKEEELSIKNRLNESIFDSTRVNQIYHNKPVNKNAEAKKLLALKSLNMTTLPKSIIKAQIDKPMFEKVDIVMLETAKRYRTPCNLRIQELINTHPSLISSN